MPHEKDTEEGSGVLTVNLLNHAVIVWDYLRRVCISAKEVTYCVALSTVCVLI